MDGIDELREADVRSETSHEIVDAHRAVFQNWYLLDERASIQ